MEPLRKNNIPEASCHRAVITLATGKPVYIKMAVNLARSFKWWHKKSNIRFYIATDRRDLIPGDLHDVGIIDIQPGQYGYGFSPKLYLNRLAPAEKTLFVDADCLCVGSLEGVFDLFAGHDVSVVGGYISNGEWFGDVQAICRQFGVAALPKFNGGVYYLEKGEMSERVYRTAQELEPRYDDIGLVRLRNKPNEELLMAIALALHQQMPIPDDGSILSDPQACPGKMHVDVLRGESCLINPAPPDPRHQTWYPFSRVNPVLVHFLGHHTNQYPYLREESKLALAVRKRLPVCMADAWATITRTIPLVSLTVAKDLLRPVYRRLVGVRPVAPSDRM